MDLVEQHSRKIERLQEMDRETILTARLNGLVMAVKNNELSFDDVLQYTNITAEQLTELLAATQ